MARSVTAHLREHAHERKEERIGLLCSCRVDQSQRDASIDDGGALHRRAPRHRVEAALVGPGGLPRALGDVSAGWKATRAGVDRPGWRGFAATHWRSATRAGGAARRTDNLELAEVHIVKMVQDQVQVEVQHQVQGQRGARPRRQRWGYVTELMGQRTKPLALVLC